MQDETGENGKTPEVMNMRIYWVSKFFAKNVVEVSDMSQKSSYRFSYCLLEPCRNSLRRYMAIDGILYGSNYNMPTNELAVNTMVRLGIYV